MRTIQITKLALPVLLALTMTACGNGEKENPAQPKAAPAQPAAPGTFAYVDLDSLQEHYQYFIDAKAALEAKSKRYENEITRLGNELEKAATDFQQKMQNGTYTTEAQALAAQNAVIAKQNNLQTKQANYAAAFQKEQDDFNKALHDSIQNFISEYNKSHGYAMIFSKMGDNILYATPAMNITDEVVAGLNKRYKKK